MDLHPDPIPENTDPEAAAIVAALADDRDEILEAIEAAEAATIAEERGDQLLRWAAVRARYARDEDEAPEDAEPEPPQEPAPPERRDEIGADGAPLALADLQRWLLATARLGCDAYVESELPAGLRSSMTGRVTSVGRERFGLRLRGVDRIFRLEYVTYGRRVSRRP